MSRIGKPTETKINDGCQRRERGITGTILNGYGVSFGDDGNLQN